MFTFVFKVLTQVVIWMKVSGNRLLWNWENGTIKTTCNFSRISHSHVLWVRGEERESG